MKGEDVEKLILEAYEDGLYMGRKIGGHKSESFKYPPDTEKKILVDLKSKGPWMTRIHGSDPSHLSPEVGDQVEVVREENHPMIGRSGRVISMANDLLEIHFDFEKPGGGEIVRVPSRDVAVTARLRN
jgi:hypothetical protein